MTRIRKRAPRACLNCRALKAKCELDQDDSEKCIRCKREDRECVFVASRRGGQNRKSRSGKIKDNGFQRLSLPEEQRFHQQQQEFNNLSSPAVGTSKSVDSTDQDHSEDDIAHRTVRNPSDSLGLLARTAFSSGYATGTERLNEFQELEPEQNQKQNQKQKETQTIDSPNATVNERLSQFCLVRKAILSPIRLKTLVSTFFSRHHQYMPILPAHRIPQNDFDLCTLAETEPLLVMTFTIIASRFEDKSVHEASWRHMSQVIQDLVLGVKKPTIGAIESLLLLSENVPGCGQVVSERDLHDFEERFSWNLVGQAVRMSYYLGLDQTTLLTNDEKMSEEIHRMRLIWTYCYFEERQTSIRFGKAFWTRGPTLCFPSPYVNSKSGSEAFHNFPTLIPSPYSQEDYASYMQALIDITNLLSSIHDLLYPSRDRTISLAHLGDYHKILDELTMGFASFKITWEKKQWSTLSLTETVWVSFYFAELYAYGFAFQAHMKRMNDSSSHHIKAQSIFPKTLSATSDAKFIIEAKNAAMEILRICVKSLHSYGAMAYLPSRYFGYFGYAAVFLIKVVFTEAVHYEEQKDILNLIKRTISCICDESKGIDRSHPLMRCAQQLKTLLQTLWSARGVNFNGDQNQEDMDNNGNGKHFEPSEPMEVIPLADDIKDMVDNFSVDQYSPKGLEESTQAAIQDLTASLANDLNGEFWLSYFNQMYGEMYGFDT